MRINCLEPQLYNKISAGEVVERPASIVKELVENSIDAGATHITISIEGGGIKKIEVADNGSGIHYDDLSVAFLPHATSKIKRAEDLEGIATLGFRGEALASIAAVSEVTLTSKQKNSEDGGLISLSGGKIVEGPTITGRGEGTTITVSNLFFNVPARQKFLKKPKTEELEITNLVSRFILANPCVSIKYIIDGKVKFISSGKGMEDAMFVIYGKEAVDSSVYIEKDYGYIKIYGYIGKPSFSKPNRTYQTIIINNRVIQNQTITGAVQNAYGELLMKKQYPFYILYIDIDYTMVDVNVHPNKHEVRFENNSDIYLKVFEVVNRKINAVDYTNVIKTFDDVAKEEPKKEEPARLFSYTESEQTDIFNTVNTTPPSSEIHIKQDFILEEKKEDKPKGVDYTKMDGTNVIVRSPEEEEERKNIFAGIRSLSHDSQLSDGVRIGSKLLDELQRKYEIKKREQEMLALGEIKVLGVIFKTYIVAEFNGSMLLIDQHAGHERILFDKFMSKINSNRLDLQPLFIPFVIKLNPLEEEFLESILPDLKVLGFEMEKFGDSDYRVTTVPHLFTDMDFNAFFRSVLEDTKAIKKITIKGMLYDKIASLACKAAVKAGDYLNKEEIEKLVKDFADNNTKLLCPHGRPIVVQIEKKELEKWFKRIV